jgi:maltose/moltooligosaccharide transporter
VSPERAHERSGPRWKGVIYVAIGTAGAACVAYFELDRQLYLVCALPLAWGIALTLQGPIRVTSMFGTIMHELQHMPETMRKLVPVQFFSWLALFAMWIYTTAAVTTVHFGSNDPLSDAYNQGANWVGVLFGAYNGFAAPAAALIPLVVLRLGVRLSHLVNLFLGGFGLISFAFIRDPQWLLLSMVGVGFAWASILSLPYAMLSDSVPAQKMGLTMGIFNFFIVIPQLVAASVLGFLLKRLFSGEAIYALVLGGLCLMLAGVRVMRVPRPARE